MKLRSVLNIFLIAIAASLFLSFSPDFALAAGNQSNQGRNQAAVLVAPEPSFEINVYPKPSTDMRRSGFGLGGDRVTLLEQVGSNGGYTWDYVRFDAPPNAEGWVRADFISEQAAENRLAGLSPQNSQNGQTISNARQETGYVGTRQNGSQGNYQTKQQQGSYAQNQKYSSDRFAGLKQKVSEAKQKVIGFFKKS